VNLIRNAEEAMAESPPERRAIRIVSEIASSDFLKVSVEDAGPGIPDAVFRRFKLPFISTKGQDGLGIGLSICRRIIEAHGGELEAHNLASGAEVWFTVPLAPAAGATG
jgi:two-component system sensor kinase FixL